MQTTKNEENLSAFLYADKAKLLNVIEQKSVVISQQERRISILEEGLRLARIKRFTPSSEKQMLRKKCLMKPGRKRMMMY